MYTITYFPVEFNTIILNKFNMRIYIAIWLVVLFMTCACAFNYDEAYSKLKTRISLIKSKCGEVCDTDIKSSRKGKYFEEVQKEVDCKSIFEIDEGESVFPIAPKKIPKFMRNYYNYNERIQMSDSYMYSEPSQPYEETWTKENIEESRKLFRDDLMLGSYGAKSVNEIAEMLKNYGNCSEARVLVIGSQSPWIEAILLEHNVKEIVTLEYSDIVTTHPKIKPILPHEFNRQYLSGELKPFDLTVSFSSLEHSGLGRYGDPLNPWGDLITMARTWCATKKGGRALIGVPTGIEDEIIFNAAKIYGPLQYSHLFANWKPIYSNSNPDRFYKSSCKWCYQPLFVVEK